jgi:tRNA (guanine37-N1)-methyltransferase
MKVPQVLISGDHQQIARWRRLRALEKTQAKRPDLLARASLTAEDRRLLDQIKKDNKERTDS